jgi:hypothetical protein
MTETRGQRSTIPKGERMFKAKETEDTKAGRNEQKTTKTDSSLWARALEMRYSRQRREVGRAVFCSAAYTAGGTPPPPQAVSGGSMKREGR